MAYNKMKSVSHFRTSLILTISLLTGIIPMVVQAQISGAVSNNTKNQASNPLPPPPSRPGMSEYKPVSYDNSMTTTQSDSITSQKGEGLPGSTPSQSPVRPYNGPSVNIPGTGIRAYFNAPVQPPYNASASYDTFAGQPGGNRNAILQQNKVR